MAIEDILVHVRRCEGIPLSAEMGLRLARTLGAHLTGLYVAPIAAAAFAAPEAIAIQVVESNREYESARACAGWWSTLLESESVDGTWAVAQGDAVEAICHAARWCDLVVTERPTSHPEAPVGWGVVSRTVFGCGVPVVVVPDIARPAENIRTVVVAWNGSREAARAVHGALALLRAAKRVIVLLGAERHELVTSRRLPRVEIGPYLARHGIDADLRPFAPSEDVGAAIVDVARAEKADLIVMGAWGHSRLTELIVGGATRHVFTHADVPLFVSH
jgi:nucleotide-binding universal stress UspA family protein